MTTDAHPTLLTSIRTDRQLVRRSPEAMLSRRYLARLRVTDAASIAAAMASSFALGMLRDSHGAAVEALICLATGLSWYLALRLVGARDRRLLGAGTAEYRNVLNGSVIVFGLLGIADLVVGAHFGRELAAALPIGVVALWLTRWGWRRWLSSAGSETHFLRRALVVGDLADVRYVLRQMREAGGSAYNVVGAAITEESESVMTEQGDRVPVVCDLEHVAQAASNLQADAVIVASRRAEDDGYVRRLSWGLEACGADLVLAWRLTDVAGPRVRFTPVKGLPLINVEIPRFEGAKHTLKRLVDVVVSGTALLLLSPLFLTLAVAISMDDHGPVLFLQTRVGKDGTTFRMVKFRSMVVDAEARLAALRATMSNDGNGMLFKLRGDPRVTSLGRILRKFSLDELPQLWNVFIGDMSLVGPRPPLPTEVKEYADHVHRRLYIKPGLTGLWQISGRSNLSWDESVRLDLYYVENWSLAGDLVILWRTLRVVLRPVGAY